MANQYLWQDEAENAVIARNILRFGYPRAFDGSLLVVSDIGYRKDYTWIFQPWLQNYLTAFSFCIFGGSSLSARLPFVLFGIASFASAYFLARRMFSLMTARVFLVIMLTCVPYLLMIRQARYYSLALFFALLLIHGYLDYAEKKRFADIKILASSFLLFNSNFGLFFPLAAGLIFHRIVFYRREADMKKDAGLILLTALILVPIFIYFKGWLHEVPLSADFVLGNVKFYLRSINRYIVPIRLIAVFYLVFAIMKRTFWPFVASYSDKRNISLILFIFVTTVLFMGIAKFRSLRYAIYLIPLLGILESYFLARWMNHGRVLASLCIVLLVTTNLFHQSLTDIFVKSVSGAFVNLSGKYDFEKQGGILEKMTEKAKERASEKNSIRSYFGEYLYEISHDYDGPIEGIVTYLKENAVETDRVKIPYGDCAVAFYTGLKVDNDMTPGKDPYPEWIIPRDYWTSKGFYSSDYYKEIQKKYEKIVLEYPDLRWENRPDDLGYHNFRTVSDYPKKVVIYKKK
ncbi:MAG: hypothetical protein A2Z72_06390 [Omnitrophica bacterium RBG_13_46_9]|nr:MAG: hypothetical protein A2Z72_06390 [Omnitrophica bacterium RBG_13_46_9]